MSTRGNSTVVVGVVVLSAALLVARLAFGGDTFQDCRYLGPSVRMYVTAWAGPLLSLAAAGLFLAGRRGPAARIAVCLVPVLLLAQLVVLWWTYAPDPAGGHDCSGLAALLA